MKTLNVSARVHSRYRHVREGKVGDRIETWPGRKQGRVFVSHGHSWLRISLPVGTKLRFDENLESRDYTTSPQGPVGTMSRDVAVCQLTADLETGRAPNPFRLALLAEGSDHPISMDYICARQVATVVSLPA